jgi:MoaA/NifB/PqqE/SkfB family radical SAM enzyme
MNIQLSLTTKCNMSCRFCLRTTLKREYNFVENIDMDIELVKKILDHEFGRIIICANRGEALLHPDVDDILKYIKKKNHRVKLTTNAFSKSLEWWSNLGKLFSQKDEVVFPLDGISNKIHNIHRASDFNVVLNNIKAFVDAGGSANWRFIKFKHNQHQVKLARKLAKALGVKIHFMNSHTYDSVLSEPTDQISKVWTSDNIKKAGYTKEDFIQCRSENYYVNSKGILFPCCYTAMIFGNEPLLNRESNKNL